VKRDVDGFLDRQEQRQGDGIFVGAVHLVAACGSAPSAATPSRLPSRPCGS
jgi:hypothetical protein